MAVFSTSALIQYLSDHSTNQWNDQEITEELMEPVFSPSVRHVPDPGFPGRTRRRHLRLHLQTRGESLPKRSHCHVWFTANLSCLSSTFFVFFPSHYNVYCSCVVLHPVVISVVDTEGESLIEIYFLFLERSRSRKHWTSPTSRPWTATTATTPGAKQWTPSSPRWDGVTVLWSDWFFGAFFLPSCCMVGLHRFNHNYDCLES